MPKFRKKPVVIEAVCVADENYASLNALEDSDPDHLKLFMQTIGEAVTNRIAWIEIRTLEGTMRADVGDWIITGVKGERYPCKPDIFEATYEPAGEDLAAERARLKADSF